MKTGYSIVPKIEKAIQKAQKILICSHMNADPDALCSTSAVLQLIKLKYPDKKLFANIESSKPENLKSLKGYSKITIKESSKLVSDIDPDLIIFLDADNFSRISRSNFEKLEKLCKTKTIISIDHHSENNWPLKTLYINHLRSSTCEEVYKTFVEKLSYPINKSIAENLLCGIISDSGRFLYINPYLEDTFNITYKLTELGVSIEIANSILENYSLEVIEIYKELFSNLHIENHFNYSYISDEFTHSYLIDKKIRIDTLKLASRSWVNKYIRSVGENRWGFTVCPELNSDKKIFSIQFRSMQKQQKVSTLAKNLGGGGHAYASGAKIEATSVKNAVDKVLNLIEDTSPNPRSPRKIRH